MAAPESLPRAIPDRRTLRSLLLWSARWLAGDGAGPHVGDIVVEIDRKDDGPALVVRPTAGADGLGEQPQVAGQAGGGPTAPDLIRHFLSDAERVILRELVRLGPTTAQKVCDAARMNRSTFFVVWGGLQGRGLIQQEDDGSFAVELGWVRKLVGGDGEGKQPAA